MENMGANNIVVLSDENGNNVNFEFLDLIKYHDDEYAVLLPCEDTEEVPEAVILKAEVIDDAGNESFVSIDDDELLDKVFNIFKEKFKEEFDFVD